MITLVLGTIKKEIIIINWLWKRLPERFFWAAISIQRMIYLGYVLMWGKFIPRLYYPLISAYLCAIYSSNICMIPYNFVESSSIDIWVFFTVHVETMDRNSDGLAPVKIFSIKVPIYVAASRSGGFFDLLMAVMGREFARIRIFI